MKREEEKLKHTKHRALKNQTHIVRVGETPNNLACLIFEKKSEIELYFWGTTHILDN